MKKVPFDSQNSKAWIMNNDPFLFRHGSLRFIKGKEKWTPGKLTAFLSASLKILIYLSFLSIILLGLWSEESHAKWWGLLLLAILILTISLNTVINSVRKFKNEDRLAAGQLILGRVLGCTPVENAHSSVDAAEDIVLYRVDFEFTSPDGSKLTGWENISLFEREVPAQGRAIVVLYLNKNDFSLL